MVRQRVRWPYLHGPTFDNVEVVLLDGVRLDLMQMEIVCLGHGGVDCSLSLKEQS